MNTAKGYNDIRRRWRHWLKSVFAPGEQLRERYQSFRTILQLDGQALDLLADLESHISGHNPADSLLISKLSEQIIDIVGSMAAHLSAMNPLYAKLPDSHSLLAAQIRELLMPSVVSSNPPYVLSLQQAASHPELAGGKAANLSAAGRSGIIIPRGFVITANSFHHVISENHLQDELIQRFEQLHADDHQTIIRIAGELQELILACEIPADIVKEIDLALQGLGPVTLLAVRSSALAEDGNVSFAGQYASELEVFPEAIFAA